MLLRCNFQSQLADLHGEEVSKVSYLSSFLLAVKFGSGFWCPLKVLNAIGLQHCMSSVSISPYDTYALWCLKSLVLNYHDD